MPEDVEAVCVAEAIMLLEAITLLIAAML